MYKSQLPTFKVTHLGRDMSDHSPLLVTFSLAMCPRGSFCFQRMWLDHGEFLDFVRKQWQRPVFGNVMEILHRKLYYLCKELKVWNWAIFGNVQRRIVQHHDTILRLDFQLQHGWAEECAGQLQRARQDLGQLLKWDAELVQQKARLHWFKEGDRNTSFFHASLKDRAQHKAIRLRQEDGTWYTDSKQIGDRGVEYYKVIFPSGRHNVDEGIFHNFPYQVDVGSNDFLSSVPSEDEVWDVVHGLNPDTAPRSDGFTGCFYRGCWSIIKCDVIAAVQDFF